MTRGDVKLMHDRLVQVCALYAEDNETIVQACDTLLALADEIEKLRAALAICADQFEKYAEYHREKMEAAPDKREYLVASEKWHCNQLLAFNAREALK